MKSILQPQKAGKSNLFCHFVCSFNLMKYTQRGDVAKAFQPLATQLSAFLSAFVGEVIARKKGWIEIT